MKPFVVFTKDLALDPLVGQSPTGGRLFYFENLTSAQSFAEKQKRNWDRVYIFQRQENGELEKIEHYQRGTKYVGGKKTPVNL